MSEQILTAPRIGINDEYVTVGSWLVKSGTYVSAGQEIASLETTKETESLKADCDGYLHYQIDAGEEVRVGSPLAVLSDQPDYQFESRSQPQETGKITAKAERLIRKYQVDLSKLAHLELIREKDVWELLGISRPDGRNQANDLIVVSGGGFAKMCIELVRQQKAYHVCGILDPKLGEHTKVLDVPVIGTDDDMEKLRQQGYLLAVNAMGSIAADNTSARFFHRKTIYEKLKANGFYLPPLIHPSAVVSPSAQLGEGTLVMECAVIGSEAVIGDDCIINTGAIVSHDCRIADHARISPGAVLAGDVAIGENTLIGMGVTIYIGVRIGRNVILTNGRNITGDVADNAIL